MLKSQKGFTLVELIVVIIIIGILAAVAVPKFMSLTAEAQAAACKQTQAATESAYTLYIATIMAQTGTRPAKPATPDLLQGLGYLDSAPTCPAGGTIGWHATIGDGVTCDQANHPIHP